MTVCPFIAQYTPNTGLTLFVDTITGGRGGPFAGNDACVFGNRAVPGTYILFQIRQHTVCPYNTDTLFCLS